MNEDNDKVVFVTIGTTKFDLLIRTITDIDVLQSLRKRGYKTLIIQKGNGVEVPNVTNAEKVGINLTYYEYKNSILEDILKADLVISHAGAGTCLEVLEKGKPLLVVVNEELMHNHQSELADQLSLERFSNDGINPSLSLFSYIVHFRSD
ncbi:hypothetical protein RUM43_007525 [Polyplax serrata]|uniref:UDP-N-acetylglucosamine transferase subunit ALG13 n=1 Tax=Polyplax serrata TaxID=468196 RepID=A0AAN8P5Z2_POLSC